VAPAIVADPGELVVWTEEIFCPVIGVRPHSDENALAEETLVRGRQGAFSVVAAGSLGKGMVMP
jgi:hypothetical protein